MSKAARRLNRVQSNISTRIKQLEQQVGKDLFVRRHRGLSLTPDGELLLPSAETASAVVDGSVGNLERRQAARPVPHRNDGEHGRGAAAGGSLGVSREAPGGSGRSRNRHRGRPDRPPARRRCRCRFRRRTPGRRPHRGRAGVQREAGSRRAPVVSGRSASRPKSAARPSLPSRRAAPTGAISKTGSWKPASFPAVSCPSDRISRSSPASPPGPAMRWCRNRCST